MMDTKNGCDFLVSRKSYRAGLSLPCHENAKSLAKERNKNMFLLPQRITDQDIQNWKFDAIRQLLAPLKLAWPRIHIELITACDQQYDPSRLGDILVAELSQLLEANQIIEKQKQDEIREALRKEREEVVRLKLQAERAILENNKLQVEIEQHKNIQREISEKLSAQNELIASQYQQIKNLTGGEIL